MKRRYIAIILLSSVLCMALAPHIIAHAATNNGSDLLPPLEGNNFTQYPLSDYTLDYIAPQPGTLDISGQVSAGFYNAINWGLNAVWSLYILGIDIIIRLVDWAFNLQIVDILIGSLTSALNSVKQGIWDPMWYCMSTVAIAWMIYYWARGKGQKMWMTVISTFSIIAIAGTLFAHMPQALNTVNNASAEVSTSVLNAMTSGIPGGNGGNAVNSLSTSLWNALVKDPYLMLEFGSTQQNEEHNFQQLMANGSDEGSRTTWFQNHQNDSSINYTLVTPDGTGQRTTYLFVTFVMGIVFAIMLGGFSFFIVWWQFVALARTTMAASYLLIALWPEHGFREVMRWGWSAFSALLYRIILSMALGLMLVLYAGIQSAMPNIGWLATLLMEIAMITAVWHEIKQFRNKALVLPLPDGDRLGGTEETPGSEHTGKLLGLGKFAAEVITGGVAGSIGAVKAGAVIAAGKPELMQRGMGREMAKKSEAWWGQRKAIKEMKKRGLNPTNADDRETFATMLKDEGQPSKYQDELLEGLSYLHKMPRTRLGETKIQPNLSREARRVYTDMRREGLNPGKKVDRELWAKRRVEDAGHMPELERYTEKSDYEKVTHPLDTSSPLYIPPMAPTMYTPERDIWEKHYKDDRYLYEEVKKHVDEARNVEYQEAMTRYLSQPVYKRAYQTIRRRKPKYVQPTTADYARAFYERRQSIDTKSPLRGPRKYE